MPTAVSESSLSATTPAAPHASLLYIGDDAEMMSAWTAALTSSGYSVTALDSPAAGLSAYVEGGFGAVFLAFDRTYMGSGLLATVMRLSQRSTPLILLSDSGARTEEEIAPFDRIFPENTVPSAVIAILRGLMESARRSKVWSVVPFAPRLGDSPDERKEPTRSEVTYAVIPRDQR